VQKLQWEKPIEHKKVGKKARRSRQALAVKRASEIAEQEEKKWEPRDVSAGGRRSSRMWTDPLCRKNGLRIKDAKQAAEGFVLDVRHGKSDRERGRRVRDSGPEKEPRGRNAGREERVLRTEKIQPPLPEDKDARGHVGKKRPLTTSKKFEEKKTSSSAFQAFTYGGAKGQAKNASALGMLETRLGKRRTTTTTRRRKGSQL